MKLIIDINENVYTRLLDNGRPMDIADGIVMERAIRNGIPLEQIRDEIERLHYHPKLDFIKNDEIVEMALEIIDKYMK